ncbi:hypothetical protein EVA_19783 [gut metagenome]|uniref:Uncharacterized protein n=1 Tax=gut metagenome TaxID=749906 RepID=J9FB42_9ZZZZ
MALSPSPVASKKALRENESYIPCLATSRISSGKR